MEEENDDEDISPLNVLLNDEDNEEKVLVNGQHTEHKANGGNTVMQNGPAKQQLLQKHSLRSINSTVVIRQLPSEGLSFQLWPAATTLVSLLDGYRCESASSPLTSTLSVFSVDPNRRPLNILELGSGTGIVGIVAAITLGANVTATDLPHVVPNIQFNANANAGVLASSGGAVNVAPLRWGHADDVEVIGRDFDVILASDVVYHDHLYEPLLQTLRMLLAGNQRRKAVFVMAHLRRWKKESVFFKKARKLFDVDVLHLDTPCEGSRVGVIVYRFVGKKG
ncbi:protein N-lysine methyltransferase METTL21A-like [Neltuma alba]|uniref:protein N-lysine methyltransferase METTL21A-like n=1 Tax=Neltuma alba TaxID=207710 RepID=UPI0010A2FD05|nr:protein N-lysine methyltransferase METTL21A-like [Prosopis alba]